MYSQAIPLAIMLIAILAGIFLNNKTAQDLKADIKDVKGDFRRKIDRIDSKLDSIQADLRQFYHLNGKLEGRIDAMEKRLS